MGTVYLGKANPMGSGGGGSITVDQTYDATSANAQSGTAVAEAIATVPTYSAGTNVTITNGVISATDTTYSAFTGATSQAAGAAGLVPAPATTDVDKYLKGDGTWGAVSGGGLQNTATTYESLTILGTPNTSSMSSVNIGINSEIISGNESDGSTAVGCGATAGDYGTAIGSVNHGGVGPSANELSVAIGCGALAGSNSIAIGYSARDEYGNCIALGNMAYPSASYQFVVGGVDADYHDTTYLLMDLETGKIPNDRINGVSGSFTTNDGKTVTITNGVITSIV